MLYCVEYGEGAKMLIFWVFVPFSMEKSKANISANRIFVTIYISSNLAQAI